MNKGILYLIPSPIAEGSTELSILPFNIDIIKNTSLFMVENIRTARRFFSSLGIKNIDDLQFEVLDKRTEFEQISSFMDRVLQGINAGVLSEAGCPGIADPGSALVKYAHEKDVKVIPLVGPSSIILALMGSGFNGQSFTFHGYLPIDRQKRKSKILEMEKIAYRHGQTQIFMETPYRNNQLIVDLVQHLAPKTQLSIASYLHHHDQNIKTAPVSWWKNNLPDHHKKPCIFLLYK
jgi:16S rRNA (cytidine1402-2'-O)-methyltransferase